MYLVNSSQIDRQQQYQNQQYLVRSEESVVRILGRYFGRIIVTITASIAALLTRQHYAADRDPTADAENLRVRIIEEVKDDAAIAVASVLAWNINLAGPTGADASEYMVDLISNFSTQCFSETPIFPKSTTTVGDRVTDNSLWRFANYAASTLLEVRSVLQGAPTPRQEGPGFFQKLMVGCCVHATPTVFFYSRIGVHR